MMKECPCKYLDPRRDLSNGGLKIVSKCRHCGRVRWHKRFIHRSDEMYRCLCGQTYKLPDIVDDIISLVSEENPVVETVVICPGCNKRGIRGGEHTWDEFIDSDGIDRSRPAIMMFGADFTFDKHKEQVTVNEDGTLSVIYPVFMGIPTDEALYTTLAQKATYNP